MGDGLTNALLSTATALTVTTYTRTGEALKIGGDRVTVSLLPAVPAANVEKDDLSASCAVDVVITDREDGTYYVTYKGSREGYHRLYVSVNGRAIQKSPFTVKVVPNVWRLVVL